MVNFGQSISPSQVSSQWGETLCVSGKIGDPSVYKPVPSKADFPALEHEILRFWKDHSVFETLRERNRGHDRYSFIDGPITANNAMGVHHAWGRTYKDVYQRFW